MTKLGIMQPYFFPYGGYFSLIKHTNEFILFDTVQFIRHGWIERNRILKQNDGWLYIKVPLQKHDRGTLIKDVRIDNTQNWRNTLLSQLQPYKKVAPHYEAVKELVETVLGADYESIASLNKVALEAVCGYLGINKKISIFSEMGLTIEPATAPDEWALNICKALGATDYWNPPGGQEFFDRNKYDAAGIHLQFQKPTLRPYDQRRLPFEPGLSILDALLFNTVQEVNAMLDDYELS